MTVFLRANQEPFPGAGIWGLTRDEADALRAELETLREEGGLASAETDYASLVSTRGIFLGRSSWTMFLSGSIRQAGLEAAQGWDWLSPGR